MHGTKQICGKVHFSTQPCKECGALRAGARRAVGVPAMRLGDRVVVAETGRDGRIEFRVPVTTKAPVRPSGSVASPVLVDTGRTLELEARVAELEALLRAKSSAPIVAGKTDDGKGMRAPPGECAYCDRQRAYVAAKMKSAREKRRGT